MNNTPLTQCEHCKYHDLNPTNCREGRNPRIVMWLDDCSFYEPEKDDNTLTLRLISKLL